jgi:hypothetical protein
VWVSEVKYLDELEDENRRLKKINAELGLQNELIKKISVKVTVYGCGRTRSTLRYSQMAD